MIKLNYYVYKYSNPVNQIISIIIILLINLIDNLKNYIFSINVLDNDS